ncbi:MAG: DNA adenine methylase [Caldilineales bacterium]|nr:DNA adenine methylase [Caldilineales bacterium]
MPSPASTHAPVKPFLKWAGGKRQLLPQFAAYYPPELAAGELSRYVEPFLGGGAVFLDVAQRFPIQQAFLFDINPELILVYRVVQQAPTALIDQLQAQAQAYLARTPAGRAEYFYALRAAYNARRASIDHTRFSDAWIDRAAQMIFLNKTCFNGLYRVNARGEFNTPMGRYSRPAILDPEGLTAASELLQRAEVRVGHFRDAAAVIDDHTFVYFDPPYRPLSATAHFTAYAAQRFDDADQTSLAQFFAHLHATRRARLMLSNSDTADGFFQRLYTGFSIHRVQAHRMINADSAARGKIAELLITNYPRPPLAAPETAP